MIPFRERSCNLGERKATTAWKTPACQEPAKRPLLPQATSDVDSASEGQINVKMYPLNNDKIKNAKKKCWQWKMYLILECIFSFPIFQTYMILIQ